MSTTADFIPTIADLPQPPVPDTTAEAEKHRHRKIGQLPRALRDRVNAMLDDSHSAREIIEALKESQEPVLPYPISEMNISDWRRTGYQKYLADQERLALVRANREAARDMVAENDTTSLAEGALQMLSSQYFDIISDFSTSALKEKLQDDPLKYSRFLNVFARLTREIVNLKKHRETNAPTAPTELPQLDEARKLNENEQNLIQDRWDRTFKIHPNHLRSKTPITPEVKSSSSSNAEAPGEAKPNPGLAVPNLQSQNLQPSTCTPQPTGDSPIGNPPAPSFPSLPSVKSDSEIRVNLCPSVVETSAENQHSKIEDPSESAICDLPSAISSVEVESSALNVQNSPPAGGTPHFPLPVGEGQGEGSSQAIETQKSEIENPNESAICDLPSAIQPPQNSAPSFPSLASVKSDSDINVNPSESVVESSESENCTLNTENSRSQSSERCHSCKSFLPALLENGERPCEHCETCGTHLRHPKLLHLYCPHCSQRMDEIFDGTTRLSDQCPKCLESLIPTPEPQTAHAE